jgi:hypothetical protein
MLIALNYDSGMYIIPKFKGIKMNALVVWGANMLYITNPAIKIF